MDSDGSCPYRFPTATEQSLDPDPLLEELLATEPVARVQPPYGGECWLLTRYNDVRTALSDLRFSREATVGVDVGRTQPVSYAGSSILGMDPPGHSRIRRLVSSTFTARRVEQLRPHAQEVVDTLLDELEAKGPPADLVEGLALPLPITMICELLGVPFDERASFRGWADTFMTSGGFTVEEIQHAHESLAGYLRAMVHERRDAPTPDLLSALVAVRADDGDALSEDELVSLAVAILVAGYETTASQLSKFVYWLLMHPAELADLREHPELVPNAIEELMRLIGLSSGASMPYITTGAVELSGGETIAAGETVMASTAAANRDPAAFPDPRRYDVERDALPHLGFGHGTHFCLGAHLARMEMQVGLVSLIRRFPDLALAVPATEVPWKSVSAVWGLEALPVTF